MIEQKFLSSLEYKFYFKKGISYKAYLHNFQDEIAIGDESPFAKYLPQNWQRQARLDRKIKLSDALQSAIEKNTRSLNWLLITEHWCGDASQINPTINKVATESNGSINLRLVYRDQNPELMDAHLTNGRSRSIPILIQLDENFNLLKVYGPRPEVAQKLVMDLLAKGEDYNIPLHTWYAKDKQRSLQRDILGMLEGN